MRGAPPYPIQKDQRDRPQHRELRALLFLVLSLADRTLEKAFLDSGKLDLGLVSASSNGIEP